MAGNQPLHPLQSGSVGTAFLFDQYSVELLGENC